jgi:adenine-specific DNA-methyltransferase
MTQFEKLKAKLAELFQLDQADLDFGIYRIMNARRDEITQFLERDLLPQVQEAFSQYKPSDKAEIQKQLDEAIQQAKKLGADPDSLPKVQELRARLADDAVDLTALENEVYSRLYDFFNRYYDEGDFISLRRYKEGVYAIPYEGEEVKLHWANHDQYYVKTTENFRDYAFKMADGHRVHFKIVEADTEKDNTKSTNGNDRRFILYGENPVADENGELVIRFEYRPDGEKRKQDAINTETVQQVIESLNGEELAAWQHRLGVNWTRADGTTSDRTILEKHLSDYTKRNTFDYFIHKDLGGFLRRELDFYIKNEVMHLDDVENESAPRVEQYLSKIKVIRQIAHKIIALLAQIENFQKTLWLKKKFVVETNYCVTLDRVPEELYEEIAANDAQRGEWVKLFAIDEIKQDLATPGYSEPLTTAFLKTNPRLVLDTALFSDEFTNKLIASFDSIDAECNGLLVHSENYQGLGLLLARDRDRVRCIYIDPPFNLGETPDYLYKVDYKDSTWISLLQDRLSIARELLADDASIMVRCSHDGNMLVRLLMGYVFGDSNFRNEIILRRAEETKGDLNRQFATTRSITVNYDNLYWFSKKPEARFGRFMKPASEKQAESHWHSFWKAEDRPKLRYEILGIDLRKHYGQWMWKKERAFAAVKNYEEYLKVKEDTGETLDEYWERTGKTLEFVRRDGDGFSSIKYWIRPRTEVMADNNWLDIKGYANKWGFKTENSELLLQRIVESLSSENDLVLDFFLGSGTTAASAHKAGRKWIGIEMGAHFRSIVLPRLKTVLNGEQSGISKTTQWSGGGMFKYIRLESYEDALANIRLERTEAQQMLLDGADAFRESYMLEYMLDTEAAGSASLLNVDAFEDPFNYQLLVGTGSVGETRPVNVDLVETFNWLLGLRVRHMNHIRGFRVVEGKNPRDEKVLVIWRNLKETTNEDLEEFFRKQQYNTLDMEFDLVYVNGDNNLMNIPVVPEEEGAEPRYKVRLIEEEFKRLMFDVKDV